MRGRIVLPVRHQLIHFPQSKLLNFMKTPSGSSCDMAKKERPVRYTGTGVGSPAGAFLSPETSSTALKRALKSSKVRPFSSCSTERSWCTFRTPPKMTGSWADLRLGCRPFNIAGAAPGYARDQTVAMDILYDNYAYAVNIKNAKIENYFVYSS